MSDNLKILKFSKFINILNNLNILNSQPMKLELQQRRGLNLDSK